MLLILFVPFVYGFKTGLNSKSTGDAEWKKYDQIFKKQWRPFLETLPFPIIQPKSPPPIWIPARRPSPFQKFKRMAPKKPIQTPEPENLVSSIVVEKPTKNVGTTVEIVKSIEMEYDPVSEKFLPKKEEMMTSPTSYGNNKKRSDFAPSNETILLRKETKKNLKEIFEKIEKEEAISGVLMRDKKNFQTGRFKFNHKILPNTNSNSNSNSNGNTNNNSDLFGLICNINNSGSHSKSSKKSINIYVDDPNFLNFLNGNWTKNEVPVMLMSNDNQC